MRYEKNIIILSKISSYVREILEMVCIDLQQQYVTHSQTPSALTINSLLKNSKVFNAYYNLIVDKKQVSLLLAGRISRFAVANSDLLVLKFWMEGRHPKAKFKNFEVLLYTRADLWFSGSAYNLNQRELIDLRERALKKARYPKKAEFAI